jgi:DNA-binding transcriptional ArsR family regulator
MESTVKAIASDKFIKASELLKAISYPYRLEILKLLEDGEYHPVYEIQAYTGVESTLLSHHLHKMKDKGIISSYRDGRFIYYKLAIKEIIKVLKCIDNCEI